MMRGVRAGPAPAGATQAAQAVESAASSSRDVTALLVLLRRGLCGDGGPVRAALQHIGVSGPQWALGSAALAHEAAAAAAQAAGATCEAAGRHADAARALPHAERAAHARALARAARQASATDAEGAASAAARAIEAAGAAGAEAHAGDDEARAQWWVARPQALCHAVDEAVAEAAAAPAGGACMGVASRQLARCAAAEPLAYAAAHRRLRRWLRESRGSARLFGLLAMLADAARQAADARARESGSCCAAARSELYPLGSEALARAVHATSPSDQGVLALAAELDALRAAGIPADEPGDCQVRDESTWAVLLEAPQWARWCLAVLAEGDDRRVLRAAATIVACLLEPLAAQSFQALRDGFLDGARGAERVREACTLLSPWCACALQT